MDNQQKETIMSALNEKNQLFLKMKEDKYYKQTEDGKYIIKNPKAYSVEAINRSLYYLNTDINDPQNRIMFIPALIEQLQPYILKYIKDHYNELQFYPENADWKDLEYIWKQIEGYMRGQLQTGNIKTFITLEDSHLIQSIIGLNAYLIPRSGDKDEKDAYFDSLDEYYVPGTGRKQ